MVEAYHRHQADLVVAETNQGGLMVRDMLRQIEPALPVKKVHAKRGKYQRAEPAAALYEQGRVHHVGCHAALEDQMCTFTATSTAARARPTASMPWSGGSPTCSSRIASPGWRRASIFWAAVTPSRWAAA